MTDTDEIIELLKEQLVIDPTDLEGELIRTPNLNCMILDMLNKKKRLLGEAESKFKQLKLDRWKYYLGKQTDEYYGKFRPMNETVIKSDVQLYLESDQILIKAGEVVSEVRRQVEILENALKQCNNRAFQIREIIALRRFESGLN